MCVCVCVCVCACVRGRPLRVVCGVMLVDLFPTESGAVLVSESGRASSSSRQRTSRPVLSSEWLSQCLIHGERLDWGPFVWGT